MKVRDPALCFFLDQHWLTDSISVKQLESLSANYTALYTNSKPCLSIGRGDLSVSNAPLNRSVTRQARYFSAG
jgi:hypothetical protein